MVTKSFNSRIVRSAPPAPAPPLPADPPLTVACVMLSAGLGGLEQSLLDYCAALAAAGHRPVAVVHSSWSGIAELERLGVPYRTCRSLGQWDPFAVHRLRRLLPRLGAAVVVTIGQRPSVLVRRAARGLPDLPHVAVTPNYSLKHLIGLEHVLATTEDVKRALIAAGQGEARISVVPNMVRLSSPPPPAPAGADRDPVMGALGRFVAKKGFADLIDALALLRDRGYRFRAVIGGSGPEERALRAQVAARGLAERIALPGWIVDKRAFFAELDVLCVPSRQETFGIVILEGFAHARALVVTDAEGPREIVTDGVDGLVVPRGDPARLADALARLLDDPALRGRLAAAGLATLRREYEQEVVGRRLAAVLAEVVRRHAAART